MPRVQPGFAFSIVCDLGFAVGLATHVVPRLGDLIWLAERTYDEVPDMAEVATIRAWRWPVFFPLGAAVRRRLVEPIGIALIPDELRDIPTFRGGNRQMGWRTITLDESGVETVSGIATDPTLPINQTVNDTALKEMLVTGWRPEDNW